jgi:hypothetical protein
MRKPKFQDWFLLAGFLFRDYLLYALDSLTLRSPQPRRCFLLCFLLCRLRCLLRPAV